MKSKKNIIEISEEIVPEKEQVVPEKEEIEVTKPKKKMTESQLEALAKARIKAQERKQELKELNAKSRGLKEQKLKADAAEFDKLQKKKELDETVKKIEESPPLPPPKKIERKVKKIIYESDSDDDVEEVVVKRNPKKKTEKVEPSYSQLADMSVEQQIKNKLQQEKITCFFNQLTGKKH